MSLVLSLLAMAACVGIAEELMFRGIGVQVFRRAGFSEGKVALYSSLVFGLVHVSNALGEGSQAVLQALIVSTSGYFFYLCLRVAAPCCSRWPCTVCGTSGSSRTSSVRTRRCRPGWCSRSSSRSC